MTNLGHRSTLSFFPVLFAGIVVGLNYPSPLSADNAQTHIVFDGSTGTDKTMVNDIADGIADNVFVIDSADGSGQRGANLFHSFDEFSIANGDTAQFTDLSNSNFSNVILRVTGGNESSIYGTIQTGEGLDTANLYLLNPTGIIFGDGASVDIGGSFYASTADQLKFKGEDTVMPTGTTSSTFYSADVEAFGFINPNPAAIT
ncbi:MAG: filamentous hemagglutinin N-terminal domain-containing protein, partial [Thiohalomonadales bacterium]